jgi:uncharacterized protein (DUF433 family)/DNA-binding transcriptional MerR regulator
MTTNYIGKGIYSVPEVARLAGVSASKIRRWVRGSEVGDNNVRRPPVIESDYPQLENKTALSFLDLVEIRFVDSFRRHGVSWKSIRTASQKAADLLDTTHPFAKRRFFTDGKEILTRVAEESMEPELLNLVRDQYELNDIVSPLLTAELDFDDLDLARRWWPRGKQAGVVLDPARNLGKPIVDRCGVPTEVLSHQYKASGSLEAVAEWYEIDVDSVRRAVEFEASLAA